MLLSRRAFLKTVAVASDATIISSGDSAWAGETAEWPSAALLDELRAKVGGRLVSVSNPLAPCMGDASSEACAVQLENLKSPFFIERQPADSSPPAGWTAGRSR